MGKAYHELFFLIVFSTKDRHAFIPQEIEPRLYSFMNRVTGDNGGMLLAVGGMEDHVHLLISIPPTLSISRMVKIIKGSSSRWVNEEFEPEQKFLWQQGYSVFSVSKSALQSVARYILNQKTRHRSMSFDNEMDSFARR